MDALPVATAAAPEVASCDDLAGDIQPFALAIGSPESLASLANLAELLEIPPPRSTPALRPFLDRYAERLLAPVELPAIRDAYAHVARGEVRELLELDRRLGGNFGDSALAAASRLLGRIQLRRLRPLRSRPLRRYLEAVESGQAHGWHVVVYGILLGLFSLPLRQGLAQYALRSQQALIESAAIGWPATAGERRELLETCAARVTPAVRDALPPGPFLPE